MKRKIMLCVLVFALLLTCAHAMAAKINNASAESASGAEITEQDDNSFKVTYTAQKDKEYVVMVVSEDGVGEGEVPTKESIGNNQNGVVAYMDQAKGDSEGKVEFTVRPNLEGAQQGAKYFVYVSSNDSSNNAMKRVGLFTADVSLLGDVNNSDSITVDDAIYILKYLANKPGYDLTGMDNIADVNGAGGITVDDAIYILKYLANKPGYVL